MLILVCLLDIPPGATANRTLWLSNCLVKPRESHRVCESEADNTMSTDTINEQIQELENLRRQTRRFNIWITLALAAIVIVGVGAIIHSFYGLTASGPKQDEFLKQLGGRLQAEALPMVRKLADPSIKRLKPALEAELKRLDARAPEVTDAAIRELNTLGTNLPVRAGIVLDHTVAKALQQRDARLRKMVPGLTDEQVVTLLNHIHLEAQDQLLKTGEKLFNPHLTSIQKILADLEKIEKTEAVNTKQEINPWQMAFLFMDVFTHEFKDLAVAETAKPQETK
jgi:hypothetical protein